MSDLKACGFLVFRRQPEASFLIMRHPTRLDLPKGHLDAGESEMECALRELREETGITAGDITIDEEFRFTTQYHVNSKRHGGARTLKTLVVFLAWLEQPVEIRPTEHGGFEWVAWAPPHQLQPATIDPLLAQAAAHFASRGDNL